MAKLNISEQRKAQIKANYKSIEPRTKDEALYIKKIEAGKARAANAIKDDSGRYVTRVFKEQLIKDLAATKGIDTRTEKGRDKSIDQILSEAKISEREQKRFFDVNREQYNEMIRTQSIQKTNRNSNQLENDLSEYSGRIIVNGERMTSSEAKKELLEFRQYLQTRINCVDFYMKPELSFKGEMKIDIPNAKQLIKDLKEYFGVSTIEELEEFEGADLNEALEDLLDDSITIITSGKNAEK